MARDIYVRYKNISKQYKKFSLLIKQERKRIQQELKSIMKKYGYSDPVDLFSLRPFKYNGIKFSSEMEGVPDDIVDVFDDRKAEFENQMMKFAEIKEKSKKERAKRKLEKKKKINEILSKLTPKEKALLKIRK